MAVAINSVKAPAIRHADGVCHVTKVAVDLEARLKSRVRLVLEQLRADGLNQREIEARTGINQGDVSKLLGGKRQRGSIGYAGKIVEWMKLDPSFFVVPGDPGYYKRWLKEPARPVKTDWETAVETYARERELGPVHREMLRNPMRNAPNDTDLVRGLHGAILASGRYPDRRKK